MSLLVKTPSRGRIWRPKVPKVTTKTAVKVVVDIRPAPAFPAQKAAWREFWQKLIAEVKKEH